jgi:hypothetical protein
MPGPAAAALLLALVTTVAASASFKDFTTCDSCVGAGFGWSVKKQRCGGYANRACASAPPAVASPPAPPRPPTPEPEVSAAPARADLGQFGEVQIVAEVPRMVR